MTLHLFVRIETGAETARIAEALVRCGPPSRAEAGCIEYRTYRGQDGDAVFLKEEWKSQAALDEHMATAHFQDFKTTLEEVIGKPMGSVAKLWKAEPLEE